MNIFVFVKRVPDTESKIRINHETNSINEEGLNFVLSPYDEFAMEEALLIREAKGGKVTALSVGSEETTVVLKKCLAMGADEAVLIKDCSGFGFDHLRQKPFKTTGIFTHRGIKSEDCEARRKGFSLFFSLFLKFSYVCLNLVDLGLIFFVF